MVGTHEPPPAAERTEAPPSFVGRGIGIWEWDVPADRVYSDERFAELYGVEPHLARVGAPLAAYLGRIHPDDLGRVREAIDGALCDGGFFSDEHRLVGGDGAVVWVLAEGRCQLDAAGMPLRFIGASFDVTDRKVADVRLRELNAELERKVIERTQARSRTWEVSPDLLGALNSEGYFETSNPAWRTVLGWSESEVASMSIFELLHPDDVERTRLGFELTQRDQPAIRFPNRYRHKQGHYRWISWVGVPEDGMVYCSGHDITDEVERAQALSRAEAALRQSQKMEAVGQLTGGVAHDFNNLLQVIAGNLHLVRLSLRDDSEVIKRVDAALAAVTRGGHLSSQLLAFSRTQPLAPAIVEIGPMVAQIEDLLRRSIGGTAKLALVVDGDSWNALVDRTQLETAVLNLVINARDAMPEGGQLTIEVRNAVVSADGGPDALHPGEYVEIAVTDTGSGMAPDVAARAFEPFFTTKPLGKGTGLGLAMVYGFMRQSGGSASIETRVGEGTKVVLSLPRALGAPDRHTESAPTTAPRGGEIVLVAEDDPSVRETSAGLLRNLGYEVLEAANADEAIAKLRSAPHIDLLFTDVIMPGTLLSTEVARLGRALQPGLAVLYSSGYVGHDLLESMKLDPEVDLLPKPYSAGMLAERVRKSLVRARAPAGVLSR